MDWKKSSFCKTDHVTGNCLEVAEGRAPGHKVIRNSKLPHNYVVCTDEEWDAFVRGVKADEF